MIILYYRFCVSEGTGRALGRAIAEGRAALALFSVLSFSSQEFEAAGPFITFIFLLQLLRIACCASGFSLLVSHAFSATAEVASDRCQISAAPIRDATMAISELS